ncbi:glutathione S-transferase-like protein, partial [Trifolium pratense]
CLDAARKVAFSLDEKEREEGFKELEVAFQFLEDELKDKFFGGEEIGLVDITGVFLAFWVPIIQEAIGLKLFTIEKFPNLYKWSQDFIDHQIVKEKLPNRETHLAFFKARYESIVASK